MRGKTKKRKQEKEEKGTEHEKALDFKLMYLNIIEYNINRTSQRQTNLN